MSEQLTNNPEALRLFFTEDIFLVTSNTSASSISITDEKLVQATPETQIPAPTVLSEAPMLETPQAPVVKFQYIGANERNILILVNDEHFPVSSLQGRELLGNILKSINLNRDDCALVNYVNFHNESFLQLREFFKPQFVFAFGVSPDQLGMPPVDSNTIVLQGDAKIIFSSNLDALNGDPTTKKLLWASLKQIKL